MEEKKADFCSWVMEHKKQLLFAGISISVVLGLIIGVNNKEALEKLRATLEEKIQKSSNIKQIAETPSLTSVPKIEGSAISRGYTRPQEPVNVVFHVRTMAVGRHHSAEKAAEAATLGIELLPNQTLVDTYTKYAA